MAKKRRQRLTIDIDEAMYVRMRLHGVKTRLNLSDIVREALVGYFQAVDLCEGKEGRNE
jgi:hypothetical protein